MKRRELSRRGFLKGLGLSVVAGVLGIRPKAVSDSIRTFENMGGVWYEWDGAPTGDILEVTDEPLRPDECTVEFDTLEGFDNVSGPWVDARPPFSEISYRDEDGNLVHVPMLDSSNVRAYWRTDQC